MSDPTTVHTHIQHRYRYVTDALATNTTFKQLQSLTTQKLTHLQHSAPHTNPVTTTTLPINTYIDHTILKPDATASLIEHLCNEARQYNFAAVCVNSSRVTQCKTLLNGSPTAVACVVGFPLGACTTDTKCSETKQSLLDGASEIDMVINVGYLKDGNLSYVFDDIVAVVRAAAGYTVKVIIETCLLTTDELIDATLLTALSGAQFVKTSTGFSTGGATLEHVTLMKQIVGQSVEVKASGGIRDYATAIQMVRAGASRLGVSAGVAIVAGEKNKAQFDQPPAVQHSQSLPPATSDTGAY